MRQFYVYILFNQSRTLYVGMTNDLLRRMGQHRAKKAPGFTAKYNVTQLAYYEIYPTVIGAIEREKQIKGWKREKKIALIEKMNPRWEDLGDALKERYPTVRALQRADKEVDRHSDGATATEESARKNANAPSSQILRCAHDDGLSPLKDRETRINSGHPDGATAAEGSARKDADTRSNQILRCAQDDGLAPLSKGLLQTSETQTNSRHPDRATAREGYWLELRRFSEPPRFFSRR